MLKDSQNMYYLKEINKILRVSTNKVQAKQEVLIELPVFLTLFKLKNKSTLLCLNQPVPTVVRSQNCPYHRNKIKWLVGHMSRYKQNPNVPMKYISREKFTNAKENSLCNLHKL